MVDTNGELVASAAPFDVEARQRFFRRLLAKPAFAIDDSPKAASDGKSATLCGSPALNVKGEVQGLVFAALDLQRSFRWGSELASALPKSVTLTTLDRDGTILFRFPGGKEGKAWTGQPLPEKALHKTILSKGHGVVEDLDPKESMPAVYAFNSRHSRFFARDVVTVLGIPKQVLLARADRSKVSRLTSFGVACGLTLALGFAMGYLSSRPLACTR